MSQKKYKKYKVELYKVSEVAEIFYRSGLTYYIYYNEHDQPKIYGYPIWFFNLLPACANTTSTEADGALLLNLEENLGKLPFQLNNSINEWMLKQL